MNKSILKTAALSLLALALAGMPVGLMAQSTNASGASKKATTEKSDTTKSEKKKSAHPFHGKLAKVDKTAKTITVGQTVYHLTADTKITKNGKPATFEDATVGEVVSGFVKPNDSGKMVVSSLSIGSPAAKKSSGQAADKSADQKPAKQ